MNQQLLQNLKQWRVMQAQKEGRENALFVIMHNKTLEGIATSLPKNQEELLGIKGMGKRKVQKYGAEILAIVQVFAEGGLQEGAEQAFLISPEKIEKKVTKNKKKEKVYSVSRFLNLINKTLTDKTATVKGEVSSANLKGHLYFSLKDEKDESLLNCFMWSSDYLMAGLELKEGMEIKVHGYPEVYKKSGRLTFRVDAMELASDEGALKKAYDELKNKLEKEGLFALERKRKLPKYPVKIGLITSRDGAVINDFLNNIGRFGYQIIFHDSRVEGVMAVRDLIQAVHYFKKRKVDLLVMIRGGGSLESLQAFNNEALIREVIDLPMPVICGIGHDKDEPLLALVADRAVSTPSIVAREINYSWERALDKIRTDQINIERVFERYLRIAQEKIECGMLCCKGQYEEALNQTNAVLQKFGKNIMSLEYVIKNIKSVLDLAPKTIINKQAREIRNLEKKISEYNKLINYQDPKRQLKLGYSLTRIKGKVVRSGRQVSQGDKLEVEFFDSKVVTEVRKVLI